MTENPKRGSFVHAGLIFFIFLVLIFHVLIFLVSFSEHKRPIFLKHFFAPLVRQLWNITFLGKTTFKN